MIKYMKSQIIAKEFDPVKGKSEKPDTQHSKGHYIKVLSVEPNIISVLLTIS